MANLLMNQCEVWLVDLNPTQGSEIQKTRPCLVVNDDAVGTLPLRVIVPFTDWKAHYASANWLVNVIPSRQNGLQKESAADCFQIRSVSTTRFVRKLGSIDLGAFEKIQLALANVLSIVL